MLTDKVIEIIEDRASLERGLWVLQEVAERRALPEEVFLPTFNDIVLAEVFKRTVELVAGCKYDEKCASGCCDVR